jgi:hypothetical protein
MIICSIILRWNQSEAKWRRSILAAEWKHSTLADWNPHPELSPLQGQKFRQADYPQTGSI